MDGSLLYAISARSHVLPVNVKDSINVNIILVSNAFGIVKSKEKISLFIHALCVRLKTRGPFHMRAVLLLITILHISLVILMNTQSLIITPDNLMKINCNGSSTGTSPIRSVLLIHAVVLQVIVFILLIIFHHEHKYKSLCYW